MIIDFIIEDLMLNSYLQKNFHTLVIHFTEGDDRYYYCFKDEGFHITYHRFLPADYKDLGV